MAVTLEQVEQLRSKVDLSYEDAKRLLKQTNGNLLDALILLERQGRLAKGAGFFTTHPPEEKLDSPCEKRGGWRCASCADVDTDVNRDWKAKLKEIWRTVSSALRHGTENHLQVWRGDSLLTSIPILILILLVIVAFWVMIPLLLAGLFFGCCYQFSGPDLDREGLNNTMENVSDTVDEIVDSIKRKFFRGRGK